MAVRRRGGHEPARGVRFRRQRAASPRVVMVAPKARRKWRFIRRRGHAFGLARLSRPPAAAKLSELADRPPPGPENVHGEQSAEHEVGGDVNGHGPPVACRVVDDEGHDEPERPEDEQERLDAGFAPRQCDLASGATHVARVLLRQAVVARDGPAGRRRASRWGRLLRCAGTTSGSPSCQRLVRPVMVLDH